MRPTMDATFEAAVLPGRLGRPDRFVGGVDGGVGVAVHLPRGRVEFVWTGGVRGVSVAPSGPGASASGTAFALTGPAVRTVVETPGPAVRLEVRGALTSVTTGKGAPPAPWVGLTLGLEGP